MSTKRCLGSLDGIGGNGGGTDDLDCMSGGGAGGTDVCCAWTDVAIAPMASRRRNKFMAAA